jgi:methylated-DNA-[protein]-cysteine S-methyltransferase
MRFEEKVWKQCKRIPKGRVSTYKEIANSLKTRAYRAVGIALKNNPYAPKVPCHRVVCSDGKVGGFKGKKDNREKAKMLRKEGIEIKSGKVNMKRYLFRL